MWNDLEMRRPILAKQYTENHFDISTGLSKNELAEGAEKVFLENQGKSVVLIRAALFDFVVSNAQLEINPNEWFQDKLNHGHLLQVYRGRMITALEQEVLKTAHEKSTEAKACGLYEAGLDFWHTMPDWKRLFTLGLPGLRDEAAAIKEQKEKVGTLPREEADFYDACLTVYGAVIKLLKRQAAACAVAGTGRMKICAGVLENLSERPPRTLMEAMQLGFSWYVWQNEIEGNGLRSMGGIDQLFYPFYLHDIESGQCGEAQIDELIKNYFLKFNARNLNIGIPLYLGGIKYETRKNGINELSFRILKNYIALRIMSPKLQIRYSKDMDDEFLCLILDSIRNGNSSFVFLNDHVVIPALVKTGQEEKDATNYTVIGCYETSAAGKELPCTCNNMINLAKVVELVLNQGVDPLTGKIIGKNAGALTDFISFENFYTAFKKETARIIAEALAITVEYEKQYKNMTSSPLLSATYEDSMKSGTDLYYGGAKYNNSGVNINALATAVDSLCVIRDLVFKEKKVSLDELKEILLNDWQENGRIRAACRNSVSRYGLGDPEADSLMLDLYTFLIDQIGVYKNGRGGIFRVGLFSIDNNVRYGMLTGATPDGRKKGEPYSRNLSPGEAGRKNGITSLINSLTVMDFTNAPNGPVLDLMIHPTAVQGKDGLAGFLGILKTFFARGGFALQFNVLDAETLRAAQSEPEKYSDLQIRLCGWNVHFGDLDRVEQDRFIKGAENNG